MEILRPQNCLVDRFGTHPSDVFTRRRNYYGYSGGRYARSGRKQVNYNRLERKRYGPKRSKSEENLKSSDGLISGHVTILKRGESLDSRIRSLEMKKKKEREAITMMLCGGGRLGPEPEKIPKVEMKAFLSGRRCIDMYAGSAFVASPSPSDLPLPSFRYKKFNLLTPVVADDSVSATRDLRRLLGLE